MSPNMGKIAGDLEMGRKPVWAPDAGVVVGDLEEALANDLLNGKESAYNVGVGSPDLSRAVTDNRVEGGPATYHHRRSSWGRKSENWDVSSDTFGLSSGTGESNRIGKMPSNG